MLSSVTLALVLAVSRPPPDAAPVDVSFEYSLSTSFGTVPSSDVSLSWDPAHRELYVAGFGPVRVFNESGMEVFSFGNSAEYQGVRNIEVLADGDLLALAFRGSRIALVRLNFRGQFKSELVPRNVPDRSFSGTVMRYVGGKIYLADTSGMRVVVLDETGEHVASYDLAEKLGMADKRDELGLRGFNVDREGNILFTIQPLFSAYLMPPGGEVRGFGQKGSAPGKFNIVGGIARDEAGYAYVVDILKSAVLVFDPQLRFVKEFGYRGRQAGNLVSPEEVVVAGGKLYVSNRARRGVSVFRVVVRQKP